MTTTDTPPRPPEPLSQEALTKLVASRDLTKIMLAVPDMQGRLQGKVLNADVFLERLTDGVEMCAYLLATDIDMTPLDGFALTGWEQGFGDFLVRPDWSTTRLLPGRPGTALILGTPHAGCTPLEVTPRRMLQTQLDRMRALGYLVKVGVESEFVLYEQSPEALKPAWGHNLDYALHHPPAAADFLRRLSDVLHEAGIRYEALKTEGAPGQVEVSLAYTDALAACDDYTLYRHLALELAQRHDWAAAFMAAPETGVGSGLHLHLSLWTPDGEPAFIWHEQQGLPMLMEQAIAGLVSGLPHLAPLYAPTVNSYKRYRSHSFAPTRYTWGTDHRGCAIRVTGHGVGARLEVRLAGADANAYLALTAYLAALTDGIDNALAPPPPCAHDAYQDTQAIPVHRDLAQAVQYFQHSTFADNLLGEDVVRHYARAAQSELDCHRTHVTDLERHRGIR
ncbi:glutamine synthetase family protein [Streptomyces griseoaurantiacus]|uniref:glutamine synthetase family protein n=1 Tax=Streptomyces griseoaurantiacus TaxID=68213 RepID=UPI00352E03C0